MSMRSTCGLGAVLSLLLAPAPATHATASPRAYAYVSPVPGARMVSRWNNVAIRPGPPLDPLSLNAANLSVVGSRSGAHAGRFTLSSDERTIVFTPDEPYALGERVHVRLAAGARTAAGAMLPELSYEFQVSRLDPRRMPRFDSERLPDPPGAALRSNRAQPLATASAGPCDTLLPGFPAIRLGGASGIAPGDAYFVAPFPLGPQTAARFAIVDDWSQPLYQRSYPGNSLPVDLKVQPNGRITFWMDGPNQFYAMDSAYALVDSFVVGNGYFTDLHDLQILPNGHQLMMSYDPQTVGMDTVVAGGNPNALVYGLVIQELDEDRNVAFQWRSWDHFLITDGALVAEVNLQADTIDYVHGNSVELCPDGNLIISSRHMNEVTKIDRQTGAVLWRMGLNAVNNQFSFPNDARGFSHQHDARVLPNGNLTLFDNGNGLSPLYSRALEYQLDEESLTATLVWEYRHTPDVYGAFMGNMQRHADGGTTIGWGGTFGNPKGTDVHAGGTLAAEVVISPAGNVNYRTFRFPWRTNRFLTDIQQLEIGSPGVGHPRWKPLKIWNHWNQPIDITCLRTIDDVAFKAERVHGSFPVTLAPGETTTVQVMYSPASPDTARTRLYVMQVSDNELVAQSVSLVGHVDATLDAGPEGGAGAVLAARARPNPFRARTTIDFTLPREGHVKLEVFDVHGRCVATLVNESRPAGRHSVRWNAGDRDAGLYFCKLSAGGRAATHKLVLGT